jgi:hypothetical protein
MSEKNDLQGIAKEIAIQRNLPYTIKVEKIDGNKYYCRSSWGNHIVYIKKKDSYILDSDQ